MTGLELLAIARKGRPNVKYAILRDHSMIGAWAESLGRYVAVASATITGQWVSMEYELLVNGELPYGPADWYEGPERLEHDCDQTPAGERFVLQNKPERRKARFENNPAKSVKALFAGGDCLPGQLDLLNPNGAPEA